MTRLSRNQQFHPPFHTADQDEKFIAGGYTVHEAAALQLEMASRVRKSGAPDPGKVKCIAGVDCSISSDNSSMIAVIVLMSWPEAGVTESVIRTAPVVFPYVPGYLSFREIPAILNAAEVLSRQPDLVVVDGHGYSHPRRIGLASHLGVVTGWTTIGCAKNRFIGSFDLPDSSRGQWVDSIDRGEVIGRVVRTRTGVKPVWVSTGHKIELTEAVDWILRLTGKFRLPEPIRQAHRTAAKYRQGKMEIDH